MELTRFSDYSLRVLLYLGAKGQQATVGEVAEAFGVSRHHLGKVTQHLVQHGYVRATKGKSGGIGLAQEPKAIRLGTVIRQTEPLALLECFSPEKNTCPIQGVCDLELVLHRALAAFLSVLDEVTLADLLHSPFAKQKATRLGLLPKTKRSRT